MSSPIFDSTFGTGRFKSEEPMTTDQSQATPRRMITDADLDYLRNINTSPGPNAGRSIDPTKPGPDADAMVEAAGEAGLIEAAEWLSTAASRFEEAADALRSEYKTYAQQMDRWAGDTRERARLFRILSRVADRPDVSGLIEAAEWHDKQVANCNKYLKQSPADHILLSIREEHKASAGYFRSRAADRSAHGELIPDCPTDGVAARQGNGG